MRRVNPEPIGIAIMAKAPVPGFAKTRLAPALGAAGAAALEARLIERALATAKAADIGPVRLWGDPDTTHPIFGRLAADKGVTLHTQPDGDLGARMLRALQGVGGPALIIGVDCPALTPEHLRAAAEILRDGMDVVFLPAEDGGYVLIGARAAQPSLFADMPWSTDTVACETRRRMAHLGLSWREPARLWDVDLPRDLERLRGEGLGDLLKDLPVTMDAPTP
jgi:uncharacterized protein